MSKDLLRNLPSVDELARALSERISLPLPLLIRTAREAIDQARAAILADDWNGTTDIANELESRSLARLQGLRSPIPVINATGVVLHTGLGRAPLSERAVQAIQAMSGTYSTLEINQETGERRSRLLYTEELLKVWTGAPAAHIVNNNAAAMFLALQGLAKGRKVIIPRAEMVEIGGSFRLPDILNASGVKMVEVGTTNKVRISDFEQVMDDETALLLKVHTSNYRVVGFTEYPSIEQMVALGRKHHVPVLFDIGSGAGDVYEGCIAADEPLVQQAIDAGTDLVAMSGDKLFGGPQSGMLLGNKDIIDQLKGNPLSRALRIDKITLAALAATLELYLDGKIAVEESLPVLRMIKETQESVRRRAETLHALLSAQSPDASFSIVETTATIGGGSVPGEEIPSAGVAIQTDRTSANTLSRNLRMGDPPVFGYVNEDRFTVDVRTVKETELETLAAAISKVLIQP
ncbi:MAG: L-seryl-tRNA(Sec) selenium transferase [Planctomycetota bacterium]|nr:L-seryl-tRNA(Sec) selenium transferase [Planctomycetota bacterium]MDA1143203.1 L-seryl-tRNA(Sec) selenium transferase [Planctomycetota bacterium]